MNEDNWYETKTNVRKLIGDLREQFPYNSLYALIVELIANSLIDAHATQVNIEFERSIANELVLKFIDNGEGMNKEQFIEYHNIASLSKVRKAGIIGFAGVGAKIFLDRARFIKTETKSVDYSKASFWTFDEDSKTPKWKYIDVENHIKTETGTYVEVHLKFLEDIEQIKSEFIIQVLREQYNALLLGMYGEKKIFINNEVVTPWRISQENLEHYEEIDTSIKLKDKGYQKVKCYFAIAKEEISEDERGIFLVVSGKTIEKQDDYFRQYATERGCQKRIFAYVLADYLIDVVTTSKSQFIKQGKHSQIWRDFHFKMSKVYGQWLEKVGAKSRDEKKDRIAHQAAISIQKYLNKILNDPEFAYIGQRFHQIIDKKVIGIMHKDGKDFGALTEGSQITTKTITPAGGNALLPEINAVGSRIAAGDEPGSGVQPFVTGEENSTLIKKVKRKHRAQGITVTISEKPDILQESWIDMNEKAIVINSGHEAFATSILMAAEQYHITRCVIKEIVEEIDVEDDEKDIIISEFLRKCNDQIISERGR